MKQLRCELKNLFESVDKKAPAPVFKRARESHSLLATDAFRRVKDAQSLINKLEEAGYRVAFEKGIAYIEPPLAFYREPRQPLTGDLAMTLKRLMMLHSCDESDAFSARLLLKAAEAGETEAALKAVLAIQAQKLRMKQPLDGLLNYFFI
jgi:hypothetical protein